MYFPHKGQKCWKEAKGNLGEAANCETRPIHSHTIDHLKPKSGFTDGADNAGTSCEFDVWVCGIGHGQAQVPACVWVSANACVRVWVCSFASVREGVCVCVSDRAWVCACVLTARPSLPRRVRPPFPRGCGWSLRCRSSRWGCGWTRAGCCAGTQ